MVLSISLLICLTEASNLTFPNNFLENWLLLNFLYQSMNSITTQLTGEARNPCDILTFFSLPHLLHLASHGVLRILLL